MKYERLPEDHRSGMLVGNHVRTETNKSPPLGLCKDNPFRVCADRSVAEFPQHYHPVAPAGFCASSPEEYLSQHYYPDRLFIAMLLQPVAVP
jgi:hypothetical protein